MIALKREKKNKPLQHQNRTPCFSILKKKQQNKTPVVFNRSQNIRFLSTINNKKKKKFKKKLFGD